MHSLVIFFSFSAPESMPLLYSLIAVGIVSLVSFAGLFALTLREGTLKRAVFALVALAIGTLFGDAFVHLIPEALESGLGEATVGIAVMSGILAFFMLEKFLFWHHSHGAHEETAESIARHDHAPRALGPLVLVADFVHNMLDGVIIGASFLVGSEVGVATTIAVVIHEIPQEIADFGLLIHSGWSRGKALMWNFFSALSAFLGLLLVALVGASVESFIPIAAAVTAGAFIYIAGSDLVPELRKTAGLKSTLVQFVSIVVGFAILLLVAAFGE